MRIAVHTAIGHGDISYRVVWETDGNHLLVSSEIISFELVYDDRTRQKSTSEVSRFNREMEHRS